MTTHNHNAATTGTKGERILKEKLRSHGFSLLNKKKEFEEHGISPEGRKRFPSPYDDGTFLSDGFIPELGYIVEYKYGEKHGTTEEKIFFDLEKIRDRVYGEEHPLVYIFWGTPEKIASKGTNRCWARVFAEKAEKENLPVEVVFATTNEGLEKWIESKRKAIIH
tara:strand:+ start:208 stop:702 length:495 start_codon:yes stop_codon:yes gene_type:complete